MIEQLSCYLSFGYQDNVVSFLVLLTFAHLPVVSSGLFQLVCCHHTTDIKMMQCFVKQNTTTEEKNRCTTRQQHSSRLHSSSSQIILNSDASQKQEIFKGKVFDRLCCLISLILQNRGEGTFRKLFLIQVLLQINDANRKTETPLLICIKILPSKRLQFEFYL